MTLRKVVAWELPGLPWQPGWMAKLECGHKFYWVHDRRGVAAMVCGPCSKQERLIEEKAARDSAIYEDGKDAGRTE